MDFPAIGGAAPATEAPGAGTHHHARLERAAQDFEAMLLKSWWSSMKTTFADENESAGGGAFGDLGMEAMTNAIAASGGLGLARMFLAELVKDGPAEVSPPATGGETKVLPRPADRGE